jgi:hypothetical protein
MLMDEIKNIILKTLENKKQEIINEYDYKMKQILNENNIAKLYYLLAESFHNTIEQGEIGIKLLKECLTNEFFKTAKTINGANYICFSNDDFDILFSKSLSKEIKIRFKNSQVPSMYYPSIKPSIIELADKIEAFLNKKSLKNFKALIDCNCVNYPNNIFANIIKIINTYRKCNKELLEKIRQMQKDDELRKLKFEEENKVFKERQAFAKNFINNLTDLNKFRQDGWHFSYSGIEDEKGKISWF